MEGTIRMADTKINRFNSVRGRAVRRRFALSKVMLLMMVLPLTQLLVFKYAPMFGLAIAFQEYSIFRGVLGSSWVGFDNFKDIFASPDFWNVFRNTLVISLYKVVFGFPVPIVLALLLNEIRNSGFRRILQTVLYLPYFVSWAIVGSIILVIFSPTTGVLSEVSIWLTGSRMNLLTSARHFRGVLVLSDIWKNAGWGTIIYLAAMSQVDPNLYEAAIVDGAGKVRQIIHITLPAISGVIVLLLILRIGWIMNAGFEQILILQNPLVMDISDVFDTFVFRVGLGRGRYSYAATAEVFKSVVSLILILGADRLAKALGEEGLL